MSSYPPCELISWAEICRLCCKLAHKIRTSSFNPDMIVAIGRGGYVPGRILADQLGLMELAAIRVEHYHGAHKGPIARIRQPLSMDVTERRILLVDDVSDTGDTFDVALAHLGELGAAEQIRSAALHHKIVSRIEPDFFAKKIIKWRWIIYPWALVEDLSAFALEMVPVPDDVGTLGRKLWRERGLRVKPSILEEVLALLAAGPITSVG